MAKKTTKDAPAAKPAKKTTTTKGTKSVAKAPKAAKAAKPAAAPRHPHGRVKDKFGSKADLVKTLVEPLAGADEDTDVVRDRLLKASNAQLLRLQRVVAQVKDKWGSRDKLIAAITKGANKGKDQDYVAKLGTFSLPRLVDLATANERRAKSA